MKSIEGRPQIIDKKYRSNFKTQSLIEKMNHNFFPEHLC